MSSPSFDAIRSYYQQQHGKPTDLVETAPRFLAAMYAGEEVLAVELLPSEIGSLPALLIRPTRIEGACLFFLPAEPGAGGQAEESMDLLDFLARFVQGGRALVVPAQR